MLGAPSLNSSVPMRVSTLSGVEIDFSVSLDTCPTADEGVTSTNTNPRSPKYDLFHVSLLRRVALNAVHYFTSSISLGRHSLVKNGSSGL